MKKHFLVVTMTLGMNYGGILQAYALKEAIGSISRDVRVDTMSTPLSSVKGRLARIDLLKRVIYLLKRRPHIHPSVTTRYTKRFIHTYINQVNYGVARRYIDNGVYRGVIVGSDQVWRSKYVSVTKNLLDFIRHEEPVRVSYAASFGRDDLDEYRNKLIAKTKKLAQRFDAISVREDSGVGVARKYWGVDAEHHVDPTLLIDADEYMALVEGDDLPLHDSDGEIFAYVLDTVKEKQDVIDVVAKARTLKAFTVIDGDENGGRPMPPVTQWIKSFMDAKYVVTDSFHGTVFSIIFNKPFIAIGNKERGLARFTSLLKMFGLEDRLVTSADEVTEELIHKPIDWDAVNAKIKAEQKRSFDYLKKHLG